MNETTKLYEYAQNQFKPLLEDEYLEHHQALGAHWGIHNGPPYPLDRSLSTGKRLKSAAKGTGGKSKPKGLIAKHKAKKTYKKRVEAANKARQAKAQKAQETKARQEAQDRAEREAVEKEMWRQNVIKTGNVEEAVKNTDKFSTDEINAIINKYQANQKLSQLLDDANVSKQTANAQNQQPQMTKADKMAYRINQIQKVTGPLSQLASDASKMIEFGSKAYDFANKVKGGKPQPQQQQTTANIAKVVKGVKAVNQAANVASKAADTGKKVVEQKQKNENKNQSTSQKMGENSNKLYDAIVKNSSNSTTEKIAKNSASELKNKKSTGYTNIAEKTINSKGNWIDSPVKSEKQWKELRAQNKSLLDKQLKDTEDYVNSLKKKKKQQNSSNIYYTRK